MAKTVLITGASRGIGRAAALKFGAGGWNVAINYRSKEAAAMSVADSVVEGGGRAAVYCADVADRAQVDRMIAEVLKDFGRIDVLVNNAGIAEMKMFQDITVADWDRIFDVNVKGAFNCTQGVLPHMLSKKEGRIINISSVWGINGGACEVHYSASKAALIGFSKALARELGASGINVNCVAPGAVDTDMNGDLDSGERKDIEGRTLLGRFGTPEDIAETVFFLAGKGGSFVTGQTLVVDGGFF